MIHSRPSLPSLPRIDEVDETTQPEEEPLVEILILTLKQKDDDPVNYQFQKIMPTTVKRSRVPPPGTPFLLDPLNGWLGNGKQDVERVVARTILAAQTMYGREDAYFTVMDVVQQDRRLYIFGKLGCPGIED
ncbi:hypothetical protein AA313_de0202346 [Arthrobotrys entomopaga]|nr:hypothetical protein AA313_de0202346 [Arthrobotrys entomopaga]